MPNEQTDAGSPDQSASTLSQEGFPAPPSPTQGPGIGTPWLAEAGATTEAGGVDPENPHLFHLAGAVADHFDGGSLQGAHSGNWPILAGQEGAVYLARLQPGGIREPHWHPSAWEMNVVISGRVKWSFVGPNSTQDVFEGGPGDAIFAPQGHFHYFENASDDEDLVVLIVFNSDAAEPFDDVPLAQSISSLPASVLATLFDVPEETFGGLPVVESRKVIVRKKRGA